MPHNYTILCGPCDHAQIERFLAAVIGLKSESEIQELTRPMEADYVARQSRQREEQFAWRKALRDQAESERVIETTEYLNMCGAGYRAIQPRPAE